ncbi:MAG: hypothetical protein AB8F26_06375 [Phycisphaerales bacterium]
MKFEKEPFNLLPVVYQRRLEKHQATQRWIVVLAIIGAAAYVPATALALGARTANGLFVDRLERSRARLEQISATQPVLASELTRLIDATQVHEVVEERIDWRPLLGQIANEATPARFDRVEIAVEPQEQGIQVYLYGMVDSFSGARDLVLRLEDSGVFDSVSLENTSSVAMPNTQIARFEVRATIAPEISQP